MKSNNSPILVCCETEQDQPIKLRKLLLSHSELNALMSSIVNEVQQCQQALNDENDKRDMYKVRNSEDFVCAQIAYWDRTPISRTNRIMSLHDFLVVRKTVRYLNIDPCIPTALSKAPFQSKRCLHQTL